MIMYTRNGWLPEVFNSFFDTNSMNRSNSTSPAINVRENDDKYIVELAAPGLKKEDFDINVDAEGELTIKMEKQNSDKEENGRYLRREFSYAKFEQTLILPDDVDCEKIAACMSDGVLTIELPKLSKEEKKVMRAIEVK